MPQFQLNTTSAEAYDDLPYIAKGFIEAMFFTADPEASTGEAVDVDSDGDYIGGTEDLTKADVGDLHMGAVETIKNDCDRFIEVVGREAYDRAVELLDRGDDPGDVRIGRDFLFTRNGDGVGFGDRDELTSDLVEVLTSAAKQFGAIDLYRGDDGKLYI